MPHPNAHLHPYPQLRTLDDTALCDFTERALCPVDIAEDIQCATCKRCGNEFEYQSTSGRKHRVCDSCRGLHNKENPHPMLDLHGVSAQYILCTKSSEFYRLGSWYLRSIVQSDMESKLCRWLDFDWTRVTRGMLTKPNVMKDLKCQK